MNNNEVFEIIGGNKLNGEITVQTSKNAVLPIMSASLLFNGEVEINNVPKITDVKNMIKILKGLGCLVELADNRLKIDSKTADNTSINCELMNSMRSSLFLLGPLLSRFKTCMISKPGGCDIGTRPIDIHISSFKSLGVEIKSVGEMILFDATKAKSGKIKLRMASVGATENIIQFACLLKGRTTILNAAREPEVVDLCNFLNLAGAKILGAGTSKITIYGVDKLKNTKYTPIGDRIVAGTIMCAVAVCGGKVTINNSSAHENKKIIEKLVEMGCQINIKNDIITISRDKPLKSCKEIITGCYPDFPTDMQSLMLTVSCFAEGETQIKETLFENRFLTVEELNKMGSNINIISDRIVQVNGVKQLNGCNLISKDLRGGASLVIASLAANGKSKIENIHFIDRGYENIEEMFSALGAQIKRK